MLGITEGSSVKELGPTKTNILIWGLFMSASMRAAVHLRQNYTEIMAVFKNVFVEEIMYLFSITQRLVLENSEEIVNVKVIDSNDPSWIKTKITNLQVIKWTNAKVHVYSDSVPCLGKMNAPPEAAERWKGQLMDFHTKFSNFFAVDGEPLESSGIFSLDSLHWKSFGRFSMIYTAETLISLRILEIELSSCPCSTTLIKTRKTMKENVFQIPKKWDITWRDFRKYIGRSLDPILTKCQCSESWSSE